MEQMEKEEIKEIMKEFSDKADKRFNEFSDKTDERFNMADKRFKEFSDKTDERFDEILTAMNEHANRMDERFEGIDKRFDGVDKRFDGVDKRFDGVDKRLDTFDQRVGHLENQMVTKDYLDNKLADLRGGLVGVVRREDEKVNTLVNKLREEDSLSAPAAHAVLEIKPLARA